MSFFTARVHMYILTLQDSSLWHNNHLTLGVLLIKQTFLCEKQSRQLYHTYTLQNIVFRVRTSSDIPCHVSGHLLTYLVTCQDIFWHTLLRVRASSDIPCHVSGHLLTYLVTCQDIFWHTLSRVRISSDIPCHVWPILSILFSPYFSCSQNNVLLYLYF